MTMIFKIVILLNLFSWLDIENHRDHKLKKFYYSYDLIVDFEKAMDNYLGGNIEEAKKRFLYISLLSYEHNWDYHERKMILYSLLRLCQIDSNSCDSYLNAASDLDPDLVHQIDDQLFPPPILDRLFVNKNNKKRNFIYWSPSSTHNEVAYFLVNGRIYPNQNGIKIPLHMAKQRIEFVFKNYESQVFIGNARELEEFKLESPNTEVSDDKSPVTLPRAGIINSLQNEKPAFQIKDKLERDTESKMERKHWYYIAAGLVVGYLVYNSQKSSVESGGPIHTSND